MATTARDVIYRALRLLRLYGVGETPSADDVEVCRVGLNDMLDSWSTSSLYTLVSTVETFNLIANKSSYTIGPGGDFSTGRPITVTDSSYVTINGVDYPLTGVTEEQYASVPYKPSQGIPQAFYYRADVPLGTLFLYFVPYGTMTIRLYSEKPLTSFPDLDTSVEIGVGYKRAIEYSLAEEMQAEFDVVAPPSVLRIAQSARRAIKRMNNHPGVLELDFGTRTYSTGNWRL